MENVSDINGNKTVHVAVFMACIYLKTNKSFAC